MSSLINRFLGDTAVTKPLRDFKPVGFEAGGFDFSFKGSKLIGGATEERRSLLGEASSLFKSQAGDIRSLREKVRPGFSEFRKSLAGVKEARLGRLGAAKTSSLGNLREDLARRRIQGSSFGQDAFGRREAEFSRLEDEILADTGIQEAETFMRELEVTRSLIGQEGELARAAVQVFIDSLNLEAGIATQLVTNATDALAGNAQVQAQMLQRQNDNATKFVTEVIGAMASDRRLKSNIVRIGTHPLGIGIYEYEIFGRPDIGVMAQEVLEVKPEAVLTHPDGYLMVHYGRL